jgi:hypothetical protein
LTSRAGDGDANGLFHGTDNYEGSCGKIK